MRRRALACQFVLKPRRDATCECAYAASCAQARLILVLGHFKRTLCLQRDNDLTGTRSVDGQDRASDVGGNAKEKLGSGRMAARPFCGSPDSACVRGKTSEPRRWGRDTVIEVFVLVVPKVSLVGCLLTATRTSTNARLDPTRGR